MSSAVRSSVAMVLLMIAGSAAAKGEWTAKGVMKQVDEATRDAKWIEGEVHWNQFLSSSINVDGKGQVWVDLGGRLRAEVEGNTPGTVLISPGYVQLFNPLEKQTEVYRTFGQPDLLVQYAMLGFEPRGTGLKRDYKVAFVKEEEIEGRHTLLLQLTPKDPEVADAYPTLMVWIDSTTWLPAQQLIRQGEGGLQVSIIYENLTQKADLPLTLFESNWPEGTRIIRE